MSKAIWAVFTKVSESIKAWGPPNMGNAQKKECFCLGSHPLVNGPISWGSTQTSYTCHGHRPCLGDIPFHKAPSFCKWQASPSFRWSHKFKPGHEYSFVGKWTKSFCATEWSPIPSLTSLSRTHLVGANIEMKCTLLVIQTIQSLWGRLCFHNQALRPDFNHSVADM